MKNKLKSITATNSGSTHDFLNNMKTFRLLSIMLICIFLATYVKGQAFRPNYQSNPYINFEDFLNGVKTAVIQIDQEEYDFIKKNPVSVNSYALNSLMNFLVTLGFDDVRFSHATIPVPKSLCEIVHVSYQYTASNLDLTNHRLTFISCNDDHFEFRSNRKVKATYGSNISMAFDRLFRQMYGVRKRPYDDNKRLRIKSEMSEWNEINLKNHFQNSTNPLEGMYEKIHASDGENLYKLALIYDEDEYRLVYLSGAINYLDWIEGEIKANLSPTATPGVFKATWYMIGKSINQNVIITFERGMMNVIIDREKSTYLKLYPKIDVHQDKQSSLSATGFALSSDGLIVTNFHVIDGAKEIKVRGVNSDFSKFFNAKVLLVDKNNDIAIIQINDYDFTALGKIPYKIETLLSGVGESIFVLGYPLRATMGDEIKLTNGIISSRTGFQGDITSYQISAPVQPGNSGGPLFDSNGNLIGIINAKHAGAENASYAIKASYLKNLIELLPTSPDLQTVSALTGKTLTQQVDLVRKFVYIIEVE